MTTLFNGEDAKKRCLWCKSTPQYIAYHDTEWGFPVDNDFKLFEKICLEGFQSGLSWLTILKKRENFRDAFRNFDFNKVALFDDRNIEELLKNEGIIRHRGKIEATINNAKRAQEMVESEGSLAAFFWKYESANKDNNEVISTSPEAIKLSKDLKKLGWKFVGPTTAYAFMQAMGLINDHFDGCSIKKQVDIARRNFKKPI